MKTLRTALAAAFAATSVAVQAQYIPTHDKVVTWVTDSKAFQDYFPTWEPGTKLSEDDNFFISRVKPQARFVNRATQARTYTDNDNQRKFSLNTPVGISDTYWQCLPRYVFDGDVFSMWQYVDEQGGWSKSWIRSTGAYSDICHKNGVLNSGGVMFFDSWGSDNTGPQAIVNMLVKKNADGTFAYLDKFIKFMRYYGIDGVAFNPEGTISNASAFQDFLAAVHEKATEYGWQFSTNWYGANNNSGGLDLGNALTTGKSDWFVKKGKVVNDVYFLNYGVTNVANSLKVAENLLPGSSNNVYVGFDIQGAWMGRAYWTTLAKTKASVCFWGNHTTDMIYQNSTEQGSSDEAVQKCYQEKLEQVFSGGNRNPANTPEIVNGIKESGASAMKKFHGLAAIMPARSTLQTLPFVTRFSLGNGLKFRNEGEVTFDNKWYGLSTQDYLPTWRWWVSKDDGSVPEDAIECSFTHQDSWWAGSCLRFSGKTKQSVVRLFKTNFSIDADADVNLVYKLNGGKDSKAKLFWSFVGSETELHYASIPAAGETGKWTEMKSTAKALGMTGQVALLGIKFDNTTAAYEMLVGELGIVPKKKWNPVTPSITKAELLGRTYNSLNYKLIWDCGRGKSTADSSMPTYNEDVDTWYFEVYSQTEGKDPILDGCTTSWAHYVMGAKPDAGVERYRVGVCAVAPDGRTRSDIAWSNYMTIASTQVEGIQIDKPVIKQGEEFRVEFKDPNHVAAKKWSVQNPLTGAEVKSETDATGLTTTISELGSYDVAVTDASGETTYYRGFIQISGDEVGAIPLVNDFTADRTQLDNDNPTANVTFDIDRLGEGTASRGLEIKDPYMFMLPKESLPKTQKNYTVGFWYKPDKFSPSKYGTNLINKRDISIAWPNNNWGAFWVHIWPEATYNGQKIMNENVISYTMYNNEASMAFWGEGRSNDNKHEIPNLMCCTDGIVPNTYHTSYTLDDTKSFALNVDVWTHVMISYDGTYQRIFFNGKEVAKNKAAFNEYNDCPIYIGGSNVYHSGMFGVIDDVQVWWKALTAESEVKEAMRGYYNKKKPDGLAGYWSLESYGTEENVSTGKTEYKFANEVEANKSWDAEFISFNGAGGEDTSSATYVNEQPTSSAGCPALPGTMPVKTTAALVAQGLGAVIDGTKGGTLTATQSGTFDVTFVLSNAWGSTQLTKEAYITAEGIDGIETIQEFKGSRVPELFNLAGQKVGKSYKGVVIREGRKFIGK